MSDYLQTDGWYVKLLLVPLQPVEGIARLSAACCAIPDDGTGLRVCAGAWMTNLDADGRTNVRISPVPLRAIRLTFRLLDYAAPGPGAALAERLWCHVPQRMRHAHRDLRPAPGTRVVVCVNGRRVVAETWGRGPAVYLSSGWGGWRGQLGALVNPIVTAGFRAVAFDAICHGESDGGAMSARASTLSEFADSLVAVVGELGAAHAIVAHSAGCVATGLAVGDGLAVGRLVFIAPMVGPMPYIDDFCHILGLGDRVRDGMLTRLVARVGRSLDDFDLLRIGPRAGVPLLVIHDRGDKEARFSDGQDIAAAWPRAELMVTDGLGHRRILADQAVVRSVASFIGTDDRNKLR